MTTPWLSVIVPVFQGATHVGAALESVAAEWREGVEVIVADDGSTDGTLEVVAGHASRLPITLVHRGGDGSWPLGATRGLSAARGEYACLLFHDDTWWPGRLERIRAALALVPGAALVLGPSVFIDGGGRPLGAWRTPWCGPSGTRAAARVLPEGEAAERLLVQNFLAGPAPVFSRRLALEGGGLDPALWYSADWDLWLRLAAAGPVVHAGGPVAGFRIHPGAMTLARRRSAGEFRAQLETVLERHAAAAAARGAAPGRATLAAARFSIEVNVALAEAARGGRPALGPLLSRGARLGPGGLAHYLRDSRITERVRARLRARRHERSEEKLSAPAPAAPP